MKTKIVSIGGGTGQAAILRGLKEYDLRLRAIVTVLDSGRSSGVIRDEFDMVAPGDLRNCIAALSDAEDTLKDLFEYRFDKYIEGMSMGNLFIAALTDLEGSLPRAIEKLSKLVRTRGQVIPATLENTHICADYADGTSACSEVKVRDTSKPNITKVYLEKNGAKAYHKAVAAIEDADYIIIGPGSLYTSVIVNLLFDGIREALAATSAKIIYIPNIATMPGQTKGYSALKHIEEIIHYAQGQIIDKVIVNSKRPPQSLIDRYAEDNAQYIELTDEETKTLSERGIEVVKADLFDDSMKDEWNKGNYMRHDPIKLSRCIMDVIRKS